MIVRAMSNERTALHLVASNPFAEWLVRRMAERGVRNNHLASAMTAKGLKMSKSMVSSYRSGATLPDPDSSDKLADFFDDDRSVVWGYVRAARVLREEPTPPAPADASARELIREVVHETLAQMGHPRMASALTEVVVAFGDAIEALPPAEREALLPPNFRDGLQQIRRRILAGERDAPPRNS
jgi:hypothetical protein